MTQSHEVFHIFIKLIINENLQELPHARSQGQLPRGATPHLRSGAAAERSNPTSKEWLLLGRRRAKRCCSTFEVRRGSCEDIPLIQGKRNPSKTVGVVRGIRGQTHKP